MSQKPTFPCFGEKSAKSTNGPEFCNAQYSKSWLLQISKRIISQIIESIDVALSSIENVSTSLDQQSSTSFKRRRVVNLIHRAIVSLNSVVNSTRRHAVKSSEVSFKSDMKTNIDIFMTNQFSDFTN